VTIAPSPFIDQLAMMQPLDEGDPMSIRAFFRDLFRSDVARARPRHSGDDLADRIDEAMGPQGGSGHGRMTGGAVYRHFEEEDRDKQSP